MNIIKCLPVIALLGLAACGSSDDDKIKPPESAENLYNEAYDQLLDSKYKDAVKSFEEVERQHPSSEWAARGQIMSGYASYLAEDYETAIGTLERFTKLYPSSESAPYAYYLIALCYYEQISDVGRDQKITEQALQALREIIRRFPDTEYARDARIKLDLTQDHLAGKEMEIGRYYLRHEDYIASINRFRFVVENYQTTSHVPEALHRLVESYLRMGVKAEAQRYAAVLGHNFPSSSWYRDSYKLLAQNGAKPVEPVELPKAEVPPPAPAAPVSTVTETPVPPPAALVPSPAPAPMPSSNVPTPTAAPVPAPDAAPLVEEHQVLPESPQEETSWWDHLIP